MPSESHLRGSKSRPESSCQIGKERKRRNSFFIFHEGNDLCHTRPPLPPIELAKPVPNHSNRKLAISFCIFAACQNIGSQNLPFPAGLSRKQSAIKIQSLPTACSPTLAAFSQAIACHAKNKKPEFYFL
jgi:hypothetical protein